MKEQFNPQEFHLLVDRAYIRTRIPVQEVTDSLVLRHAKRANLSTGDHITVQCMDHNYETVLGEAEYVVTKRIASRFSRDLDDGTNRQGEELNYQVTLQGEWWEPNKPQILEGTVENIEEISKPGSMIKWNPGKKVHQVFVGNEIVYESSNKAEAQAAAEAA